MNISESQTDYQPTPDERFLLGWTADSPALLFSFRRGFAFGVEEGEAQEREDYSASYEDGYGDGHVDGYGEGWDAGQAHALDSVAHAVSGVDID